MRLGIKPTFWQPKSEWSKLRSLYGLKGERVSERHRHRYEVNPNYISQLEDNGMTFIGKDETGVRMEVIELKDHPWFVGVQFHPEYLSRVLHPSKPYLGFIAASAGMLEEVIHGGSPTGRLSPTSGLYDDFNHSNGVNGLVNGAEKAAF